jgi:hypothetical protein
MRFNRCAGGHNFDFDTDVCTRCGIDRRQYRDGGNPECAPRHMAPVVTTIHVGPTHLGPSSVKAFDAARDPLESEPTQARG